MKLKAYFLLLLMLVQHITAFADTFLAKVIGIKDGDTIEVLVGTTPTVIRLEHIDCPEKKQAFGNVAKQALAAMCFGKFVTIQHNNKYDRNKRLIAEIILENKQNANLQMVLLGYAWHFKKYSKDQTFAQAEISARAKKVGLWKDVNPIAPWDWRKLPKELKPVVILK